MSKKTNTITLRVITGIVALIFLLGIINIVTLDRTVQYEEDEYGTPIKIVSTKCNALCQLFSTEQQAFFSKQASEYFVGDSVQIKEEIRVSQASCEANGHLEYLKPILYRDGVQIKVFSSLASDDVSQPCPADYSVRTTITYSPSSAGVYTLDTAVKRTNAQLRFIDCEATTTISGACTLIVQEKESAPECTLTPSYTVWELQDTVPIDNGNAYSRYFKEVSSSCEYINQPTEFKVTCNDGYVITGTTSTTAEGIDNTCELAQPDIIDPIVTTLPTDTSDTTDTVDTNGETNTSDTVGSSGATTIWSIVNGECVRTSSGVGSFESEEACNESNNPINLVLWGIIIVILIASIVVIVLGIKLIKNRKKK